MAQVHRLAYGQIVRWVDVGLAVALLLPAGLAAGALLWLSDGTFVVAGSGAQRPTLAQFDDGALAHICCKRKMTC